MDSWERRKRGEVIIGFEEGGEESSGNDWGKGVMEEDEDNQRRRKAGVRKTRFFVFCRERSFISVTLLMRVMYPFTHGFRCCYPGVTAS